MFKYHALFNHRKLGYTRFPLLVVHAPSYARWLSVTDIRFNAILVGVDVYFQRHE